MSEDPIRWHETCGHEGCDQEVCYCDRARRCAGTEDPSCPHGASTCESHRADQCPDCRQNRLDDAGRLG